jgi:hypothetical protein
MTLRDELFHYASNGVEAYPIAKAWFIGIIRALQHDPRIKNICTFELELLLADQKTLVENELFSLIHDRVHLDHVDVVDGVNE